MVKIFTVMYILCSVYTANPDISSPAFLQGIAAAEENMAEAYAKPEEVIPPKPESTTPKDYFDGLKSLGLYKEDSKDDIALNKRNAIIRFQSLCNFKITGEWNEKCQNALTKIFTDKKVTYNDTAASPPSEGKWFALNKTTRILTYYDNNKVITKYPVAVGKASTTTPSGKYTIVNKVINPAWGGGGYAKPIKGGSPSNPLGYRWMGLSYKDGSSVGIHGNNSPYSIGKEISHGCIRMINSDVEELFTNTALKSAVWIGTEKELKDWGVVQPEIM